MARSKRKPLVALLEYRVRYADGQTLPAACVSDAETMAEQMTLTGAQNVVVESRRVVVDVGEWEAAS
jgi:hypothetical protein